MSDLVSCNNSPCCLMGVIGAFLGICFREILEYIEGMKDVSSGD